MQEKSWVAERRRWQDSYRETLVVGVVAGPGGPSSAELCLHLGQELTKLEGSQRALPNVSVWEADFWAPSLMSILRHRGDVFSTEPPDLWDFFHELAGDIEFRNLVRPQGIPRNDTQLEIWRDLVDNKRFTLPDPKLTRLHLFPARTSIERLDRLIATPSDHLVRIPAREGMLPGVAVIRALLATTSRTLRTGITFLTLPSGWSPWLLMLLGQVLDVVIVLRRVGAIEETFLSQIAQFLQRKRRDVVTRPFYEEEILLDTLRSQPPGEWSGLFSQRYELQELSLLQEGALSKLAADLDLSATGKAAGIRIGRPEEEASPDEHLAQALKKLPRSKRTIRILVEEGNYGEKPIEALSGSTAEMIPGFHLKPVPVTHQGLFDRCLLDTKALDEKKKPNHTASFLERQVGDGPVDLVTFPYYMLGTLAESGLLTPVHTLQDSLEDDVTRAMLDEEHLEGSFHQMNEMCRYQGVLYAVPYILTQKILLVKTQVAPGRLEGEYWSEIKEQLLRWSQQHEEAWPLLINTATDHVGLWYDWLEMVFAHGSNDFLRRGDVAQASFRGSDYGECQFNDPRTLEATELYLDLLVQTTPRAPGIDWDKILGEFLQRPDFWATIVWSDMAAAEWSKGKRLEEHVRAYQFPLNNRKGRLSIEGWVLGVPSYISEDEGRRRLAAQFIAWFLHPQIQARYARGGGNVARRDVGYALGEIQRKVHRTVLSFARPALKITFREAPLVIDRLRRGIASLSEEYKSTPATERRNLLRGRLETLAREIVKEDLASKARYRDTSFWEERAHS